MVSYYQPFLISSVEGSLVTPGILLSIRNVIILLNLVLAIRIIIITTIQSRLNTTI